MHIVPLGVCSIRRLVSTLEAWNILILDKAFFNGTLPITKITKLGALMADHSDATKGLTAKILIAMLAGGVIGAVFKSLPAEGVGASLYAFFVSGLFDLGGDVFVASLKMLVVPLVFVSLVCGVISIGGNARIGMISVKTLAFYLLTTAIAISLALLVANIIDPGKSVEIVESTKEFSPKENPGIWQTLKDLVPENIVLSMAEGKMLQIIVFAILFGVALSKVKDEVPQVVAFFSQLDSIIMGMVMILMRLAPIGVFCLIAKLISETGFDEIGKLIKYFGCVLFVLVLHASITYGSLFWFFTRLSPITFFRKLRNLWAFAFSTASSSATIPLTLETVEEKLGVKNEVASFTVPLGATINMDGTAIMQGVATVFIAQFYAIDIGFTGYLMVILTATLASIGTAGVPGVGLIMLAMVLAQVNLPVEGIALIIGVDRILDMVRTAVNITGDAAASVIVAKSENMLDEETFNATD